MSRLSKAIEMIKEAKEVVMVNKNGGGLSNLITDTMLPDTMKYDTRTGRGKQAYKNKVMNKLFGGAINNKYNLDSESRKLYGSSAFPDTVYTTKSNDGSFSGIDSVGYKGSKPVSKTKKALFNRYFKQ
jgi:hypothetical protein